MRAIDPNQIQLFDLEPLAVKVVTKQPRKARRKRPTIQERFEAFHAANPSVYRELVSMARRWLAQGHDHCGLKMLWEVLRFRYGLAVNTNDDWKLPNNYTSRYARLIGSQEPDLNGIFELRGLRAE